MVLQFFKYFVGFYWPKNIYYLGRQRIKKWIQLKSIEELFHQYFTKVFLLCFLKVEFLEENFAVLSPKSSCPPPQAVFCFNDSLKLSPTI